MSNHTSEVAITLVLLAICGTCRADEESCKAARAFVTQRHGNPTEDRGWHLLTQTNGGTVRLLSHLTYHEAEYARARALGEPATKAECDAADAKAATAKRDEDERNAKDEAIIRARAPACPPGAKKADYGEWNKAVSDTWWKKNRNAATVEVTPGQMCGETRFEIVCLLPDRSIDYFGSGASGGCSFSSGYGTSPPGDIKSAEVFR